MATHFPCGSACPQIAKNFHRYVVDNESGEFEYRARGFSQMTRSDNTQRVKQGRSLVMRSTKSSSITLSALAVSLLGGAALLVPAQAQATGVSLYSYAAKAICEDEGNGQVIETDVNVHNPRYEQGYFFWKLANAEDIAVPVAIISTPRTPVKAHIWGDGVLSIDCELFGEEFEGYIVVYSQKPLDVVGVLEVEDEEEGVEDMEITPVTPTKIVLPLATWNLWNNQAT
jgi:hypothetical protein